MTPLAETDKLFFERADATLDRAAAEHVLGEALAASDDGELYLEYRESESISLDDGRIRSAGFDTSLGFGLRAVAGEATGYAHAGELSEPALRRAAASVAAVASGHSGTAAEPPRATNARLYSEANPLGATEFPARTALLSEIDVYARGKDPRVRQVMASIFGEWQAVQIMRADGTRVADLRPLVRLNVAVVVEKDGRRETGSYGTGGRFCLRQGDRRLGVARRGGRGAAPGAGEPRQRAGAGWRDGGGAGRRAGPASCCTRRSATGWRAISTARRPRRLPGCSGSASRSPGVTVVDDGTLPDRRGSLTVDDEGTPTSRTVLIEDGILVGFMQDRLNARLMGDAADRQRAPPVLRARADAAHDQHRHAGRHAVAGGDDPLGEARPLRGEFRRRAGGHHVRQVRVLGVRGVPDRGRQGDRAGEGSDADRQRAGRADQGDHGRQRHGARSRRRAPAARTGRACRSGVGQPTLKLAGLTVGGTAA